MKFAQLLVLFLTLSVMIWSCQKETRGPIFAAFKRATANHPGTSDATTEVAAAINAGTPESAARSMLDRENFVCHTEAGRAAKDFGAPEILFCSLEFGGLLFDANPPAEYRVVLGLDAGKVTTVWARHFYTGP